MLLSYSPEGSFVLTLFELVLSGLSLMVLLWIRAREPVNRPRPAFAALTLGFGLLVAAFGAHGLYCRLALGAPPAEGFRYVWLLFLSDAARLLAATALVIGYLIQRGMQRRAWIVAGVTLGLTALAAPRFASDASLSMRSIVPLTTVRAAEVMVLFLGVTLITRSGTIGPATGLFAIGAGRAAAVVATWQPSAAELTWALEQVATLTGLILLALAVEHESRQTSVRFFLRLNLTFLVLASSLILVVTEIERRQFAEFSALHAQDVAEFVRGHMLYYSSRGNSPDQALGHPDVVRKLVAEFGRYPDLRRVQVSLRGRTMALAINKEGEVDQQFWNGKRAAAPPVSPADFAVAPLMQVPILASGRPIGSVTLEHSLERINEKIGWQMQAIFAVFTLFVAIASAVTGMLVLAADRTIRRQYDELERTRRRLSLAERLASIGAVADGVAHEINNPAGILVARTDYLLSIIQGSPLYADIRDDLDTIRRQGQRIAKTVKDLLTFTRPARLCRELTDLHAVLESALALVHPLAWERGLTVEHHFAADVPPVCGDRNRLEQVFLNLLTNAVQAVPASGQITLITRARQERDELEVVVRDTGSGIPAEHLDRIFDPFFTTKPPRSGTGLGLSIAYAIIRDHGGTIDVSSTPGIGTEFRVTLPSASRRCPEVVLQTVSIGHVAGRPLADRGPAPTQTEPTDD